VENLTAFRFSIFLFLFCYKKKTHTEFKIHLYKESNKMHFFICVHSKTWLCVFRTDTPFIIGSLRIAVCAAACTYHTESSFRINTYEKVRLVALFIQLNTTHGQYNIKFKIHSTKILPLVLHTYKTSLSH
jgi:hypothetical protein